MSFPHPRFSHNPYGTTPKSSKQSDGSPDEKRGKVSNTPDPAPTRNSMGRGRGVKTPPPQSCTRSPSPPNTKDDDSSSPPDSNNLTYMPPESLLPPREEFVLPPPLRKTTVAAATPSVSTKSKMPGMPLTPKQMPVRMPPHIDSPLTTSMPRSGANSTSPPPVQQSSSSLYYDQVGPPSSNSSEYWYQMPIVDLPFEDPESSQQYWSHQQQAHVMGLNPVQSFWWQQHHETFHHHSGPVMWNSHQQAAGSRGTTPPPAALTTFHPTHSLPFQQCTAPDYVAHLDLRCSAVRFCPVQWQPLESSLLLPGAKHQNTRPNICIYYSPTHMTYHQQQIKTRDLFVAQLPFDMPLCAIQEVALAVGVQIEVLQASPHYKKGKAYDGCAFAKLQEQDAIAFVQKMHKTVLFDVGGVWFAQSSEARAQLNAYCERMQKLDPVERREKLKRPIPFSAMTVEFAKRSFT